MSSCIDCKVGVVSLLFDCLKAGRESALRKRTTQTLSSYLLLLHSLLTCSYIFHIPPVCSPPFPPLTCSSSSVLCYPRHLFPVWFSQAVRLCLPYHKRKKGFVYIPALFVLSPAVSTFSLPFLRAFCPPPSLKQ